MTTGTTKLTRLEVTEALTVPSVTSSGAITGTDLTASGAIALDGFNVPTSATFTIGAEATNAITVAVQVKDGANADLATRTALKLFLSDDANGDSVVATAPDGGMAAGTDGWLATLVTGKIALVGTEADGDLDVVITHAAGAKTLYVGLIMPTGKIVMSSAVTFAA